MFFLRGFLVAPTDSVHVTIHLSISEKRHTKDNFILHNNIEIAHKIDDQRKKKKEETTTAATTTNYFKIDAFEFSVA